MNDIENFGPAMQALTPERRLFVLTVLDAPTISYSAAYARCFPGAQSPGAIRVSAWRVAHDPRVLAAFQEEASKRLQAGAILGASVLIEIAQDPLHKDRLKAASTLLNRIGLHEKTEHKTTVEHTLNSEQMIAEITTLAKTLGLDPAKLIGQNSPHALAAPTIDAEFEEVGSTEGLEDLL